MTTYIYHLCCPDTGAVRYIGKSNNPERRLYRHLQDAKNPENYNQRWIASLVRHGKAPQLRVVREIAPEENWQEIERAAIAAGFACGLRLTNTSAGGEGVLITDPAVEARRIASVTKAWQRDDLKESASRMAIKRCATTEARELMRLRSVNNWKDPAYALLVSQRVKDHYSTDSARLAQSKRSKKAHANPETKKKRAVSLSAAWQDPARKEKRIAAMVLAQNAPDVQKRRSDNMKARHQDPAFKAKVKAIMSDPEMIKRRNASISAAKQRKKALQSAESSPELEQT